MTTINKERAQKALDYWDGHAHKLTSYYATVHSGVPLDVQSYIRSALQYVIEDKP